MKYTVTVERTERRVIDITIEAESPDQAAILAEQLSITDRNAGTDLGTDTDARAFGTITDEHGTHWI